MASAYGAAWALRQIYVEPGAVALSCNAAGHPPWCALRAALLFAQHNLLFGAAALAAGALALLRGGRASALSAAVLALFAIANYNVDMGALGLVFGLIAGVAAPAKGARDAAPR